MERMLSDPNTYASVKSNPVNSILNSLKELLKRWKSLGFITDLTHKRLYTSVPCLPRAYGLPKIHKPGNPLRIIISSINSPLHNLASFLQKIISDSLKPPPSFVYNSYHLSKMISEVTYDDSFQLISLDVISLFTNIPLDLATRGLERRWHFIENNTSLPKKEFFIALRIIFNSTFFLFNDKFYKQTFGAPMGSPLSPILADVVMQDLEQSSINSLSFQPPLYVRYVDDIALMAPSDQFHSVLQCFNSYHSRLQFTMEIGGNTLNFLDITIIKNNNILIHDWYHKPTFSGRYLNYFSNHPINQKKCTVMSLVDGAFFLSHPTFHTKNFDMVIKILLDNNYPLEFIYNIFRQRLRRNFFKNNNLKKFLSTIAGDGPSPHWFVIPFVENFSVQLSNTLPKNMNFRSAFYSTDKLSKFIKVQKDPLPPPLRSSVVYKIDCRDCDASYVGQTSRLLKTRITEHRNHINRNSTQKSVITDHRIDYAHDFKWDCIKILDTERSYHKRLISETLHIKNQSHGLNLQSDTENLDRAYLPLVDNS